MFTWQVIKDMKHDMTRDAKKVFPLQFSKINQFRYSQTKRLILAPKLFSKKQKQNCSFH